MNLNLKKNNKKLGKKTLNKSDDLVSSATKNDKIEKEEKNEEVVDAVKVIEEFNDVSKTLDNLIKPNMDVNDFKEVLQGELDRIYEAEEKIKKDIKTKEEDLKNDIKKNKMIDYWNGLNSGWFN